MRNFLLLLLLAVLAGIGGFGAYRLIAPASSELIGKTAYDLQLHDLQGATHRLSELRGKWVLINFWASWCAPCMDELPLLVEAQKRYGMHGLQILGPALDDADSVAPVVTRFGINYPVSADFTGADAAMQAFGNEKSALPYSVLIDPQGRVDRLMLGALKPGDLDALMRERIGN
ncbi:TlpA family protein disulfide reductase [Sinimarinibacterium sp. CAU 1509]|uniref:TlpA family protein disulfide reductase n=1 Tax=Sinimarinibacterium sp. CAU 1509 TaxID=2562283 RepID=UPI0010AD2DA4|nr:TlpA disulfide reductase family protein [Sinimarinibacterium sp. CAU 1509]TJY59354.1 TlpA family protein disulfide reductase [Sinimarinibacterium sp. CAU 1509]